MDSELDANLWKCPVGTGTYTYEQMHVGGPAAWGDVSGIAYLIWYVKGDLCDANTPCVTPAMPTGNPSGITAYQLQDAVRHDIPGHGYLG